MFDSSFSISRPIEREICPSLNVELDALCEQELLSGRFFIRNEHAEKEESLFTQELSLISKKELEKTPRIKRSLDELNSSSSNCKKKSLLRFTSHILLDNSLRGSSLEGAYFSEIASIFIDYLKKVPTEPELFDTEKIVQQLMKALSTEESFRWRKDDDSWIYLNYFLDSLEKIDSISKRIDNSWLFLKKLLGKREFRKRIYDLADQKIASSDFIGNFSHYNFIIIEVMRELISTDELIGMEMLSFKLKPSDIEFYTFDHLISEMSCYALLKLAEDYHRELTIQIEPIINDFEAASIGEEKLFFSGYYNLPTAHAIIVKFKKTAIGLWEIQFFNTGEGTEFNLMLVSEQKSFISPVMTFKNVPEDLILNPKGSTSFLIELLKFRSPYFFLFFQYSNRGSVSKIYYEFIKTALLKYCDLHPEDGSHLISPQKSGTCVFRSIKAYITYQISDIFDAKNWNYLFKAHVLADACLSFENEKDNENEKRILLLAAKNLSTRIHKDFSRGIRFKNAKRALATAVDAQRRLKKALNLETEEKNLTTFRILKSASECLENKVEGSFDFLSKDAFETVLDYKTDLHETSIKRYLPLPFLSLEINDLSENLDRILKNKFALDLFYEYILALPLPSEWTQELKDPEIILKQITQIFLHFGFKKGEKNFACMWKLGLIGIVAARQIHPFLKYYPIYDFGIGNKTKIPNFFFQSLTLSNVIRSLAEETEDLNKEAKKFDRPLFFEVTDFDLPVRDVHHLEIEDASVHLYSDLVDSNPQLHKYLLKKNPSIAFSKLALLEELISDFSPLIADRFESGLLEKFGFKAISQLKVCFAILHQIQKNQVLNLSEKPSCKIDLLNKRFVLCWDKKEQSHFPRIPPAALLMENRSFIDEESEEKVDWSLTPPSEIDSFLSSQKERIGKYLGLSDAELDFVVELITVNAIAANSFYAYIDVFSKKENISKVYLPLYFSLFRYLLLSSQDSDPLADRLIQALVEDEALRKNTTFFFKQAIIAIAMSKDPIYHSQASELLTIICNIKYQVEKKVPFLSDLQNFLSENLPVGLEIYEKTFCEDKESIRYFIEQLKTGILNKSLPYETHRLIARYFDFMKEGAFVDAIVPTVRESFSFLDDHTHERVYFVPEYLTIWFDISSCEAYGINLCSFDVLYKKNGQISSEIEDDLDFADDQSFVSFLHERYRFSFARNNSRYNYFYCPFGDFCYDKSTNRTSCIFSDQTERNLPLEYQRLNWVLVTDKITNERDFTDPEVPLNPRIEQDEIRPSIPIFPQLPYTDFAICQIFFAEVDEKLIFVTIDEDTNIGLLITVVKDNFYIFDTQANKNLTFLNQSYFLSHLIPKYPLQFSLTESNPVISILSGESENFELIEKNSTLRVKESPEYCLVSSLPDPFSLIKNGLAFKSSEEPQNYKVVIPPIFFENFNLTHDNLNFHVPLRSLLHFQIFGSKVSFRSLKESFYYCYLLIIENSDKSIDENLKFFDELVKSQTLEETRLFIYNSIGFLSQKIGSYGHTSPKLSVFLLKAAYLLDMFWSMDLKKMGSLHGVYCYYLEIEKSLPASYRLNYEEKSHLINHAFGARSKLYNALLKEKSLFTGSPQPLLDTTKYYKNGAGKSNKEIPDEQNAIFQTPFGFFLSSSDRLRKILSCEITREQLVEIAETSKKEEKISSFLKSCLTFSDGNRKYEPEKFTFTSLFSQDDLLEILGLSSLPQEKKAAALFSKRNIELLADSYAAIHRKPPLQLKKNRLFERARPFYELLSSEKKRSFVAYKKATPFQTHFLFNIMSHHLDVLRLSDLSRRIQLIYASLMPLMKSCFACATESKFHLEFKKPINHLLKNDFLERSSCFEEMDKIEIEQIHFDHFERSFKAILHTLKKILAHKEQILIFALKNTPVRKNHELYDYLLAFKYSHKKAELSYEHLFQFIPDDTTEPMAAFLGFIQTQNDITSFSRFNKELQELLAEVLFLNVEIRNLTATLDFFPVKTAEKSLRSIEDFLTNPRDFGAKNLHWLLFEYVTHMTIRPDQKFALEKLEMTIDDGRFKDQVVQIIMGGGKTSVISTILSLKKCLPEHVNVLITPSSQLTSVVEQLNRRIPLIFKAEIFHLSTKRKDMNTLLLKSLLKDLQESSFSATMIATTPEVIQGIELEFLYTLEKNIASGLMGPCLEHVEVLAEILKFFRHKGHAIVDEFAFIADVNKITNFPSIQPDRGKTKIEHSHILLFQSIFQFLCSNKVLIEGKKAWEFSKIATNEQMLLDSTEIDALKKALAFHLTEYLKNKFPTPLPFEVLLNFLADPYAHDETFHIFRKQADESTVQTFALVHFTIHQLLPSLFKKCGGRNYGRSPKSDKVVPYLGVGSAASTEFGFMYETLCYHFFTAAQFGISKRQIKAIAHRLYEKANLKAKLSEIKIDETKEGIAFRRLTGILLSEIYKKPDEINKLFFTLDEERKRGEFKRIFAFEVYTIEEHVGYYPDYLSSNPHNLFSSFFSVRGLTGTPWNHLTYQIKFQENLHLDLTIEKKIQAAFESQELISGMDSFCHLTSAEDPDSLMEEILNKISMHPKADIQAIIDCGGFFKNFSNFEVASSLYAFFTKKIPVAENFAIIYFDRIGDSLTCDHPHFINSKYPRGKALKLLSVTALAESGISYENCFVYFDERHTIGTDIPLKSNAIALITIDEKTSVHQFSQGLMRMRDYFKEQKVLTVIPETIVKKLRLEFPTASSLYEFLKVNEKAILSQLLPKSYRQQIEDVIRSEILNLIIDGHYSLFASFKKFFVTFENYDFAAMIPTKGKRYKHSEQLIHYLHSTWNSTHDFLMFKSTAPLELTQKTLGRIRIGLNKIRLSILRHSEFLNADFNPFTGCEFTIENDTSVEQERQTKLERSIDLSIAAEAESYQFYGTGLLTQELPLDFDKIISHFSQTNMPLQSKDFVIGDVGIVNEPACKDYALPYFDCFEKLFLTSNSFKHFQSRQETLFSPVRKQIKSFLAILKPIKSIGSIFSTTYQIVSIGLTAFETEQAMAYLLKNPKKTCFLLNSQNRLLVSNPHAYFLESQSVVQERELTRLEISVYNHAVDEIMQLSHLACQWLKNDENPPTFIAKEMSIGQLRKRLLKILLNLTNNLHLTEAIESLAIGDVANYSAIEKQIAHEKIDQALDAYDLNSEIGLKNALKDFPKKFTSLMPQHLLPFLPVDCLESLFHSKKLSSLPDQTLSLLSVHQISCLPTHKRQKLFIGEKRKDLVKFFAAESFEKTAHLTHKTHAFYLKPICQHHQFIGFPNLGNTCYANAVLKVLFSHATFIKLLIKPIVKDPDEAEDHFSIRCALQSSIKTLLWAYQTQSPKIAFHLKNLFKNPILSSLKLMLIDGDADEFFKMISQAFHLSEDPENHLLINGVPTNIIPLNFLEKESTHISIHRLIQLANEDGYHFSHLEPDKLKLIAFQLPRFAQNSLCQLSRNNQLFTDLLKPIKLLVETTESPFSYLLSPKSFICHKGSLNFGHYTAITSNNGEWIVHDDISTYKLTASEIEAKLLNEAYVAFYEVAKAEIEERPSN